MRTEIANCIVSTCDINREILMGRLSADKSKIKFESDVSIGLVAPNRQSLIRVSILKN